MSEKKEQRIYDAVHNSLMTMRIRLRQARPHDVELDEVLSQAQHAAGMAAVAAYRAPLRKKAGK